MSARSESGFDLTPPFPGPRKELEADLAPGETELLALARARP